MKWLSRCKVFMVELLFTLMHTGKNQHGSGCLLLHLVWVCWSALRWSVPHVFNITVTRLASLSGEMENVRDLESRSEQLPNIWWNEKHTRWMAGWLACWRHSVGAEQRVEAVHKKNWKFGHVFETSRFLASAHFPTLAHISTQILPNKSHTQHLFTAELNTTLSQW